MSAHKGHKKLWPWLLGLGFLFVASVSAHYESYEDLSGFEHDWLGHEDEDFYDDAELGFNDLDDDSYEDYRVEVAFEGGHIGRSLASSKESDNYQTPPSRQLHRRIKHSKPGYKPRWALSVLPYTDPDGHVRHFDPIKKAWFFEEGGITWWFDAQKKVAWYFEDEDGKRVYKQWDGARKMPYFKDGADVYFYEKPDAEHKLGRWFAEVDGKREYLEFEI